MATKAPRDLQPGDRLVSTRGPLTIGQVIQPELEPFVRVVFIDGSAVNMSSVIMVEVAE